MDLDMDLIKDREDCLSDATDMLRPKSDAERERCRSGILRIITLRQREILPDMPAKSRKQLASLQMHFAKATEILDELEPAARRILFASENIEHHFQGLDIHKLSVLSDVISERSAEAGKNVPNQRGGVAPKVQKIMLVYRCWELFEKWRPGEAKKSSEDFLLFLNLVNSAAGGKDDESFERALSARKPSDPRFVS